MATDHYTSKKYLKIRDLAAEDRPREKLLLQGAHSLSNAELLAILIGSGTQHLTSVDLAKQLLHTQQNSLTTLAKRSTQELKTYRGIGPAKAAIIASAMELTKRIKKTRTPATPKITTSRSAYQLLRPKLADKLTEECWIILLTRNRNLIQLKQISKGGITRTTVDPKVIFKAALEYHAPALILAHNHPSGNPNPSSADIILTDNLTKAGQHLEITLLDHLILTENAYFSFLDKGLI